MEDKDKGGKAFRESQHLTAEELIVLATCVNFATRLVHNRIKALKSCLASTD